MKKKIVEYIAFACCFALLGYAEKKMGIYGFAVPFLLALVFCRRNVPVVSLMYAGGCFAFNVSLFGLIYAFSPAVVTVAVCFILYKTKRKMTLQTLFIMCFLSLVPRAAMSGNYMDAVKAVVSLTVALLFTYCCVNTLFPLLVKKLGYPLQLSEKISMCFFLVVISMGVSYLRPYNVNLFYTYACLLLLLSCVAGKNKVCVVAALTGVGASIAQFDVIYLAFMSALGILLMAFAETKRIVTVLAACIGALGFSVLFDMGLDFRLQLPMAAGILLSLCFPTKLFNVFTPNYNASPRSMVNRDRRALADKLSSIGKVFYEMQDILSLELQERRQRYTADRTVAEVTRRVCGECVNKKICAETYGSVDYIAKNLALCAGERGRVTLLDVPPVVSGGCKKISSLISATNDAVALQKRRAEADASIEEGRKMIIEQMAGVGMILERLSSDMKTTLGYDSVKERELTSALLQCNIVAEGAVVYGKDKEITEVSVTVRECDAGKPALGEIVSSVLGMKMAETDRERIPGEKTAVHFSKAKRLGILLGEASRGEETLCGDNRQVLKLPDGRLMIILADGMGTGTSAYQTSKNGILMIESFYKAGFDHETVMSTVARLLSLRDRDDFNALDIAVFDGEGVDFIKQGGRESFFVSDGVVEILECGSLPLTPQLDTAPMVTRREVKENDLVVMTSDGVTDALTVDGLRDVLETSSHANPQSLADKLLTAAAQAAEVTGKGDDMTVIAFRVIADFQ